MQCHHTQGKYFNAKERDEFDWLKKRDERTHKERTEDRMERRITRKLVEKGTGSNAWARVDETTSSDTDSSADSRS